MSGSKSYKLKYPVQFGEEKIAEIEIRRPKGRDVRKVKITADGSVSMTDMMELAASLSGHPPVVIDELDAEDLFEVLDVVTSFLPSGRRTGSKR